MADKLRSVRNERLTRCILPLAAGASIAVSFAAFAALPPVVVPPGNPITEPGGLGDTTAPHLPQHEFAFGAIVSGAEEMRRCVRMFAKYGVDTTPSWPNMARIDLVAKAQFMSRRPSLPKGAAWLCPGAAL